jgi:hypothetical protein
MPHGVRPSSSHGKKNEKVKARKRGSDDDVER